MSLSTISARITVYPSIDRKSIFLLFSEILKKALEVYIMQEKRWELIYKWGEEKAKELKIKDEEDVERLIQELRRE